VSQEFPIKDFKWMISDEFQDWDTISCIVDADLEYPKELYDYLMTIH